MKKVTTITLVNNIVKITFQNDLKGRSCKNAYRAIAQALNISNVTAFTSIIMGRADYKDFNGEILVGRNIHLKKKWRMMDKIPVFILHTDGKQAIYINQWAIDLEGQTIFGS